MKYILRFILLITVLLHGCAAAFPLKPEETSYQKIIELPAQSKGHIYEKSRQWIAERFKSAKSVIEYENKEEGVIIANNSMTRPESVVHISGGSIITYTMKEEIKDNKARLTFNNFEALVPTTHNALTGQVYGGGIRPVLQGDLEGIHAEFGIIANDLQAYILKGDNKDW